AVCRLVEELSGDLLCAVMLLDPNGSRMRHGARPSLPGGYGARADNLPLTGGPCGMAVSLGKTVIVSDIAADDRWPEYRALATSHGLRACWSTPISSAHG